MESLDTSDINACIDYCIKNKENLTPHNIASILINVNVDDREDGLINLLTIAIGIYPFPCNEEWQEKIGEQIDSMVFIVLGETPYSQDVNIVDYWRFLLTKIKGENQNETSN